MITEISRSFQIFPDLSNIFHAFLGGKSGLGGCFLWRPVAANRLRQLAIFTGPGGGHGSGTRRAVHGGLWRTDLDV